MKPLSYFAVASQQVATHPVKLLKLEATLNASATEGLFLQLHDSNATPANAAVPIKSWPAAECGFKEFEMGELVFAAGMFLALSTTAGTYTQAGGGSDLVDILNVELINAEEPTGTTIVGDKTTLVNNLEVWADGAGPKKLIAATVTGFPGRYLQLFAASPSANDIPLAVWELAETPFTELRFGSIGRDVFSVDASGERNGCYLVISTDATKYVAAPEANAIQAEYK